MRTTFASAILCMREVTHDRDEHSVLVKAIAAGVLFAVVGLTLQHWVAPVAAAFLAGVLMSLLFRLLPQRSPSETVARTLFVSIAAGATAAAAVWFVSAVFPS